MNPITALLLLRLPTQHTGNLDQLADLKLPSPNSIMLAGRPVIYQKCAYNADLRNNLFIFTWKRIGMGNISRVTLIAKDPKFLGTDNQWVPGFGVNMQYTYGMTILHLWLAVKTLQHSVCSPVAVNRHKILLRSVSTPRQVVNVQEQEFIWN